MPVLQKTETKWFGFVTVSDIVRWLTEKFMDLAHKETKDPWEVIDIQKVLGDLKVKDVFQAPVTRKNIFHPVPKGFSMLYACELLCKEPVRHSLSFSSPLHPFTHHRCSP